ncbi:hypothetical protein Golax_002335 [Gossypium laxum]|uniref:Photosystem I P700 chlorophyll a apoprotein A1 n=2 Tax=Magnoliopsida TaxID=3398 RepID=A0A7J9ARG5_9ROSI|nr:hypothetical protein [Gossypium laxum]
MTGGLWLNDISHHHLAIEIVFLIAGHMYKTNWGIGHSIKDILEAHKAPGATAPGATTSNILTWGCSGLVAVGGKVALLPIPLGTIDFLVQHIHAFTIHVTVLILLKGVLFARSSLLIYDKANLNFCFPCDGLGRGDMSSIPLGSCLLRTILDSSITINGWLHISYGHKHPSGRGYWEELIESIISAYNKLKVAPATQPRALSIVQGRAVGDNGQEDLKGIMALRFPRFSQGLAQDPTTRHIWFGITVANDFKSHDDITDEYPQFGKPVVEAFTRGGTPGLVNITYSGVY